MVMADTLREGGFWGEGLGWWVVAVGGEMSTVGGE